MPREKRFAQQEMQKQPQEVFFKKNCSTKFRNIHRKETVLESRFNRVAALKPATSSERDCYTNPFFEEHLQTVASGYSIKSKSFLADVRQLNIYFQPIHSQERE